MIKLAATLKAWPSDDFEAVFLEEIHQLKSSLLPLQQGLRQSSYVSDSGFNVTILNTISETESLKIKIGVFYKGIIAGSCCSDDPGPVDEISEYCEIEVLIDKQSALTGFAILPD